MKRLPIGICTLGKIIKGEYAFAEIYHIGMEFDLNERKIVRFEWERGKTVDKIPGSRTAQ